MGFEPTSLHVLGRMLKPLLSSWDSVVSKGEMWAFDWNSIVRSHSQMMNGTHDSGGPLRFVAGGHQDSAPRHMGGHVLYKCSCVESPG